MTVGPVKESSNSDKRRNSRMERFKDFDSESGGSSEEFGGSESPRSVFKMEGQKTVHHQVLKIREEDSHLGEDIGEGLSTKEKLAFINLRSNLDALFRDNHGCFIFRGASPLSGKNEIKTRM